MSVEVSANIEGLLYYNNLSWGNDGRQLAQNYNIGDEIEVKIIELSSEKSDCHLV